MSVWLKFSLGFPILMVLIEKSEEFKLFWCGFYCGNRLNQRNILSHWVNGQKIWTVYLNFPVLLTDVGIWDGMHESSCGLCRPSYKLSVSMTKLKNIGSVIYKFKTEIWQICCEGYHWGFISSSTTKTPVHYIHIILHLNYFAINFLVCIVEWRRGMATQDWHVLLKLMSRSVEIEIFTVVGSLVLNSRQKCILKCKQCRMIFLHSSDNTVCMEVVALVLSSFLMLGLTQLFDNFKLRLLRYRNCITYKIACPRIEDKIMTVHECLSPTWRKRFYVGSIRECSFKSVRKNCLPVLVK